MIGEKIRKIRTLKGFSQEFVSEKLKMKQPEYSKIENGKSKITLDVIQELAEIFEIDVIDLINFDESQVFNNTFNQESNGFFNVKKVVNDSFKNERNSYLNQIKSQNEEIMYLRNKLDKYEK